jgi:succinoglycan biosynthesis protein ExoA
MFRSRKDPPAALPSPHTRRPRLWQGEPQSPAETPAGRTSLVPFISVLVPVRNEGRFITATLRQLLEQHYDERRFEVIVADGDSTDDTPAQVQALQRQYPNLWLVSNPGRWSSAGRNAALKEARGDLIVIIDGHCELDNQHYLADLADAFARSDAACLGRPQPLDVTHATLVQKTIAACRASRLGHHPDSFIYSSAERFVKASSVAVAYRRKVFDMVGTFDERFDACEDVEFNHRLDRAGLGCFFSPRIQVRYHPRGTLRGLFRQMIRYGRGRVRLLRKHPDTFTLPGFIPAMFTLGLLLGPLLGWLSPWQRAAYLGCIGLYAAVVLVTSLTIAVKVRDIRGFFWSPLVFLAVHLGAGMGILLEWLKPQKPPARPALLQPVARAGRRAA